MVSMWRDYVTDVMETLVSLCRKHEKPAAMYAFSALDKPGAAQLEKRLPIFAGAKEAVRALVVSHEQCLAVQKKGKPLWIQ